jgi:hypothetical protein
MWTRQEWIPENTSCPEIRSMKQHKMTVGVFFKRAVWNGCRRRICPHSNSSVYMFIQVSFSIKLFCSYSFIRNMWTMDNWRCSRIGLVSKCNRRISCFSLHPMWFHEIHPSCPFAIQPSSNKSFSFHKLGCPVWWREGYSQQVHVDAHVLSQKTHLFYGSQVNAHSSAGPFSPWQYKPDVRPFEEWCGCWLSSAAWAEHTLPALKLADSIVRR